jgi:hypothetical protein
MCLVIALILSFESAVAQDHAADLNKTVYSPTVQTLPQGVLALRASIRFGDMGGVNGGYSNFYGLDELQDSYLGLHYGLTSRVQLGISRTKGSGVQRQLVNGELKLKLLTQSDSTNRIPVGIAFSHVTSASLQLASRNPESLTYFKDLAHRFSYASQIIISRSYSSYFSIQALAGYQHRNIAALTDKNGLFYAGLSAQITLSNAWGLIFDGLRPISDTRTSERGYYPLLGVGLSYVHPCGDRWILECTNGRGLIENDFIPYSRSDFRSGELRIGLTFVKPLTSTRKNAE